MTSPPIDTQKPPLLGVINLFSWIEEAIVPREEETAFVVLTAGGAHWRQVKLKLAQHRADTSAWSPESLRCIELLPLSFLHKSTPSKDAAYATPCFVSSLNTDSWTSRVVQKPVPDDVSVLLEILLGKNSNNEDDEHTPLERLISILNEQAGEAADWEKLFKFLQLQVLLHVSSAVEGTDNEDSPLYASRDLLKYLPTAVAERNKSHPLKQVRQ